LVPALRRKSRHKSVLGLLIERQGAYEQARTS
jgi:hypothetical protein